MDKNVSGTTVFKPMIVEPRDARMYQNSIVLRGSTLFLNQECLSRVSLLYSTCVLSTLFPECIVRKVTPTLLSEWLAEAGTSRHREQVLQWEQLKNEAFVVLVKV